MPSLQLGIEFTTQQYYRSMPYLKQRRGDKVKSTNRPEFLLDLMFMFMVPNSKRILQNQIHMLTSRRSHRRGFVPNQTELDYYLALKDVIGTKAA